MIIDLVGGTGGSAFTINKNHIFADNTARDSYFALNPTEKEDGVLISVGFGYQEYNGVNWIEKSPILKGNKGDKGDKGDTGERGLQGIQGETGLQGNQGIQGHIGATGAQGETGNGVSTIIKTGTAGLVDTYTITFTDRTTTTFDITNGLNGTNGVDGQNINHVSKTAGTSAPGTTDTYAVWGDLGETINLGTFTVYNGVNGGGTVDLSEYYKKTETETLLSNKVDKEVGKGLSTNDFTDTFKQALELNKVQNISTDSVNKKLVVTYTNGTFVDLNLDDIVTDVKVEGAVLDATTNVLTILSSDGGADVTVDLSVFVTNQVLSNALVGKADKVHSHTTSDITGLDTTLSNKVDKNEAIVGATKTKITYDSNGLVTNGADLSASDIPNLPQSKITNLETNLSNKIDRGIGVVGATKTKITYNDDGIITGGADLEEADLPEISQAKITNLVSDLSNKQSRLISGTNIKTINGQSVLGNGNIFITAESASPLLQPIITSPANGAVDYIGSITSTYTTSEYFVGVQDWVRWEASTDENFTTLIDSYEGSDNLTNWTPAIGGLYITTVYVRTKQGLDNYLSVWSEVISYTIPNIYVDNPTITVEGTPNDVPKNPTISGSAFSVMNGTDTHISTDWQVLKASDSSVVWESVGDTVNKTSIKTGDLVGSTAYIFKMRYKGATYGYSQWVQTTGTTTIPIGIQGKKGFGVAPTHQPFALLGLAEMTGTNDPESDNYGNYIHTNGSIVCWCPKAYYRVGSSESPRFATYGANALDIVGAETFSTTAEANTAGYALHRAFINAGAEQSGFFIDKYMNSKDGTTASKSVFGGVPISLASTAGYTVSKDMTGCTGIFADAVVLSKARGTRWNTATAFMYGYLAMVSVAQAQSATNTTDVAWYDPTGVYNFPKGCNNNALSDVNDTSVVYVTSEDSGDANKPKTGATVGFAKTTHNGSANGVADLNGGMWEVTIGITNFGTSATDTATIANDTIYVLKQSVDVATLTGGWNTANDVWGNATNLATKYDLVTNPHPLGSSTGNVNWGNGSNAVLQNDLSGVNRDICGFIPKNSSSTGATGVNLFGNDRLTKNNKGNLVPLTCGNWNYSAAAGVFSRYFGYSRSYGSHGASFRASAYVAL